MASKKTTPIAASEIELHVGPSDVAVFSLPARTTLRAVRESGITIYAPDSGGLDWGDLPIIGRVYGEAFGGVGLWTCGDLRGIRNGHFSRVRPMWHEAARQIAKGGVVYIEHELQDYHGRQVWTPVRIRAWENLAAKEADHA